MPRILPMLPGSTTDLSSYVLEFPPQPGLENWVVLFYAWRPLDGVDDAERRDHVPYRDWERAGYLTLCPGDMIDFEMVQEYCYHRQSWVVADIMPFLLHCTLGLIIPSERGKTRLDFF